MTKTIQLITLLLPLGLTFACNKSESHQGHDHADHQATAEQQTGDQAQPTSAETSAKVIPVAVGDKGFQPSRVELKKGQDATLRFTRTSDDTCATKVVFPELKVEKELPLNQAVDVKVPTDEPRELAFQCGMGMYKSAVVIN